jgi:TolB-like protein/Tfp pilus assembly protein PilF
MQQSLWQSLKQRKIVQWAVAYLIFAYGLLEVFDILGGTFGWPRAIQRVWTVLLAFGFGAALVIAWFHGERGHQRMPKSEIALLALLALAASPVAWRAAATATPGPAATDSPTGDAVFTSFDPATASRSVAVLPFANMTGDPQNDYLADGITEDIIAELGNIAGLRVISRTSVMRYRNTPKTITEIGAELNVGTILEGSVQVSGDRVRVVAQLIDVGRDEHLWSSRYDGELGNIFALQSQVARDVAQALNTRLVPAALAAGEQRLTTDPEAYRFYAKGLSLVDAPTSAERQQAAAYLDSAIARDPDFARAYEALAEMQTPAGLELMPVSSPPPAAERALSAAEKALQLNPRLAGAQSAWAFQHAIHRNDVQGAENAARKAIESNPSSAPARIRFAQILSGTGRFEEAMGELTRAMSLDPLSSVVTAQMGEVDFAMGHADEAIKHLHKSIELDSANVGARVTLALALKEQGQIDDAILEIERAVALEPQNPFVLGAHGYLLGTAGRTDEARRIAGELERRAREGDVPPHVVAQVYTGLGAVNEALEWLRRGAPRGRAGPDQGRVTIMTPKLRRTFDAMRDDPRLRGVLDSLGLVIRRAVSDSLVPRRRPPRDSMRRGR